MSVVVIGDANVDLELRLPSSDGAELHGNPDPVVFGGGSAANTAAALARLQVPCRFVGTVGDDDYGRFARQSLERVGVDVAGVLSVTGTPTVMVIVVVTSDGERLIYVWPPTGGAHAELTMAHAVAAVANAKWLHVSGVCLRVGPARAAVLAAMDQARARAIPVSLDLNLRLENWGWDNNFREVATAAVQKADVVFGAAEDEIIPMAQRTDPEAAASALAGEDRVVIARLGAEGSFAYSDEGLVTSPSFAVDVVDTVGAGDAFNAGFIASRMAGGGLAEAMRWGNATAALSICQRGARSTPERGEVQSLVAE